VDVNAGGHRCVDFVQESQKLLMAMAPWQTAIVAPVFVFSAVNSDVTP
jgi:hypothetical protein